MKSRMPAGFPSPALDYLEAPLDLNKQFIPRPLSTFYFQVEGDSMINAFIPHNAYVLVDRSLRPQNGDIVLAKVNGGYTIKFLKKNDFKCWLVPANSKYRELEITPEMECEICGVATTVFTEVVNVKRCML